MREGPATPLRPAPNAAPPAMGSVERRDGRRDGLEGAAGVVIASPIRPRDAPAMLLSKWPRQCTAARRDVVDFNGPIKPDDPSGPGDLGPSKRSVRRWLFAGRTGGVPAGDSKQTILFAAITGNFRNALRNCSSGTGTIRLPQ